jgi:Flp pilus assembly protein TadG
MMLSTRPSAGRSARRRGTIVALMALLMMALICSLGLAIDLGMLTIARAQAQNAADLAALTSARTLDGDPSTTYNQSAATTNGQNVLTYNCILGQSIQSSQLVLAYGSYDYNQTTQTFNANFPATTGAPYTAVTATVTANNLPAAFSKVYGSNVLPTVVATAQAVHRPRDIALVMDLSGSMRFGTCLGFDFYTTSRTSNNPDTLFPTFGHYSSASASMQGPTSNSTSGVDNYTISPSNTTVSNSSYSLTYVNNFYQNTAYASTLIRAFDSYTSTDGGNTWTPPTGGATPQLPPTSYASVPGGDLPLYKGGSTTTYATNVKDVVGSTTRNKWWELDGYSGDTSGSFNNADLGTPTYASNSFNGYTQGPGYYGETFFIWPPDPRRPLNTGTATSYSTTAADSATINQFLQDFGYGTATDFANAAFKTTLASAIATTSATSITVNSSTPFPMSGLPTTFRIKIDSEIMVVTAASGTGNTTWTVQRAQDGTTAATHALSAAVGLVTAAPLNGIYGATTTAGSQNWPWPKDGGAALGTYLTTKVYIPVSQSSTARLLQTTDAVYKLIMRLYNWNYVVDNLGTTPCDWRIRFFGTNDNTKLFNNSGSLNLPGASTYTINYPEILRWIAAAPNPFPLQLRAGRVKYYGAIPTQITGTYPNFGSTDQRFWVEFINYALGFQQTGANSYQDVSAMAGYGSDFTWGTVARTAPPTNNIPYMSYTDNPARPRLRHWFGPMAMVDFLHNMNMSEQGVSGFYLKEPGDGYEAPLYTGKQAFLAAVDTMKLNHPNDWVAVACYSWPRDSATGTGSLGTAGRFNCVTCPLGTNYSYAKSALVFPFSTINADGSPNYTEVTPYDADPATGIVPSANFVDTGRADGDTCFAMGLMMCYNQFATTATTDPTLRSFASSSPITFPAGMAGGMGRKGAQKVIIFETDGLANCMATANLVNKTTYNYYQIRYDMNNPSASEFPSVTPLGINDTNVLNQVYTLVQQLANDYGTSRNPFRLYAIGFGPVFQGPDAPGALQTLQTMQYYAGTQSDPATPLPANQVITGTDAQMSANMTSTFTSILQSGVQIALIK